MFKPVSKEYLAIPAQELIHIGGSSVKNDRMSSSRRAMGSPRLMMQQSQPQLNRIEHNTPAPNMYQTPKPNANMLSPEPPRASRRAMAPPGASQPDSR